jgi:hypothetical protein
MTTSGEHCFFAAIPAMIFLFSPVTVQAQEQTILFSVTDPGLPLSGPIGYFRLPQ